MSAFLGPIHYWLYHKISLQQENIEELLQLATSKGMTSLDEQLEEKYGTLSQKPLEEIIDENNIHGWLQDKVSLVEYKIAEIVKALLQQSPENINNMKEIFYKQGYHIGRQLTQTASLTAPQLFKGISDSLLDGMPCDHAIEIAKQSPDSIVWRRVTCVHQRYFEEIGVDISNYYQLRDAWLQGFAEGTQTDIRRIDEVTYQLERK